MTRTLAVATFALLLVAVLSPMVVNGSPLMAMGEPQAKEGPAAPLAAAAGVDNFVLIVSTDGFNGTAGNVNMTVTVGDTVRIKFIYGHACPASLKLPGCENLAFDNAHQLEIMGYNLKSSVIDTAHNTTTIQFIAGTDGSFQIKCIIDCEGMDNMQNGWLAVV